MSIVDHVPTYSQEQLIAMLVAERDEARADRDRIFDEKTQEIDSLWEELEKRDRRLDVRNEIVHSLEKEVRELRQTQAGTLSWCEKRWQEADFKTKLWAIFLLNGGHTTYSASLHGGGEDVQLTSMSQMNKGISGTDENTNTVRPALKPLRDAGIVTLTEVDCQDGRTHYAMEVDREKLLRPQLHFRPTDERTSNGGNKRCPQCGTFCRKRITVNYECEKCGIEFDGAMNPLGTPVDVSAPVPQVSTVSQPAPTPIPVDWNTPIDMTMRKADADTFGPGKMKGIYDDE